MINRHPSTGFTGLFIQRSVATTLIMVAITIFGAVAYKFLPVSDLPNIDLPTLVVAANLPAPTPRPWPPPSPPLSNASSPPSRASTR